MTPEDKELIRLAALAFFDSEDEATHAVVSLGWNPKDSNEDAFMLAAWLDIWTHVSGRSFVSVSTPTRQMIYGTGFTAQCKAEDHGDVYTALRRAILQVAAEIGRLKEEEHAR